MLSAGGWNRLILQIIHKKFFHIFYHLAPIYLTHLIFCPYLYAYLKYHWLNVPYLFTFQVDQICLSLVSYFPKRRPVSSSKPNSVVTCEASHLILFDQSSFIHSSIHSFNKVFWALCQVLWRKWQIPQGWLQPSRSLQVNPEKINYCLR